MSVDLSSSTLQRDLAEKKARLEALKARRQERIAAEAEAEKQTEDQSGRASPNIEQDESNISGDASFAAEVDRSISISAGALIGSDSLDPTRSDDSFTASHDTSLVDSSITGALNSSLSAGGRSSSRRSISQHLQLQAIKHSLEELSTHTAAAPISRRQSMMQAGSPPPPPPPPPPHSDEAETPLHSGSSDSATAASASPATAESTFALPTDPASQSAMIDELLLEIQSLNDAIRSKNDDLVMAGDLGSVLLQSNEEANKRIDDLQALVDSQERELFSVKEEVRSHERRCKKLTQHVSELTHIGHESESELEILRMELELERANHRATEVEMLKLQRAATENEELHELTIALGDSKSLVLRLEHQLTDLQHKKDELESQVHDLIDERTDLQRDLAAAEKFRPRCDELAEQLAALKAADTVNVLAELQWENQRLNETLQEYESQYAALSESTAKDQALLRNLQTLNESLQQSLSESRIHTSTAKVFESLAADVADEDAIKEAAAAAAAAATAAALAASAAASNETTEEKNIRLATAAAAMHLGSLPLKAPRSSLASGSASLAYTPDKVDKDSPLKPITFSPLPLGGSSLNPANSISASASQSASAYSHGPLSPKAAMSGSAAAAMGTSSRAGPGMLGFLSALISKSSTSSANSTTRKLDFSAPKQASTPGTTVWDEDELDKHDERTSSHATAITGRKPGERDADWSGPR